MEEIVRCMDCGYCDVEPWGTWCNKENAELNDVYEGHKCDSFFLRIEKESSYSQLSKALCGKGNATLDEMLEAAEQLKHRAEPENRPLTLAEVLEHVEDDEWSFVWIEHRKDREPIQLCPWRRSKTAIVFCRPLSDEEQKEEIEEKERKWRCWPRKPTQEQMKAEKWEE